MKKLLLTACLTMLASHAWTQCVLSCYTYTRTPATYSVFPSAGVNAIPQFSPSIDDGITAPIPLGFSFDYYCSTYTAVLVCSNGFIQMDIGSPPNLSFSNPAQAFPNSQSPNGIIALNMNDFDPNIGGTITYATIGTAPNRMFVVTYSNVPIWTYNNSINTGQIVLYENGSIIEVHSTSINASNSNIYNGTQGIEDPTGSAGNVVPGRSAQLFQVTTPDAYRWTPVPIYTPAPLTGTLTGPVSLCQNTSGNYSLSTNANPTQFNWVMPGGWVGNSMTTAITATAFSSGNISVSATYTCGTTNPVTLAVNVIPSPFVSITQYTPQTMCSGGTVTITTAGAAVYTLEPGTIVGSPPFTFTPMTSTSYSVTGTDANGCVSANTVTAFVQVNTTPTVTVNSGTICNGSSFVINPTGAASYTMSTPFTTVTPVPGVYNYTILGMSTDLCLAEPVVSSLTVYALPAIVASANRTTMCTKSESVNISVTGGTSYTWSSGQTTNSFAVSPQTQTTYVATGVDVNGCVNTASVTIRVIPCTGVEKTDEAQFHVFPNPSAGVYHVKADGDYKLEVINLLGERIYTAEASGEITFDLSRYPAGQYMLLIDRGTQRTVTRLVKE